MIMPHELRNKVKLVPSKSIVKYDNDMPLFDTISMVLVYANDTDHGQGLMMKAKMKRKITSEMMTTFLPSTLLLMITFATTFFKPYFFEAALTVNLTTMLVMTTIFISKMDGLPPTSAIKMIDIWLIMCQLVPFCEVVLLTAIEYNSGGEQGANGEKQKTINHHGTRRVIKVGEPSDDSNSLGVGEKPEKAWGPPEDDGCSTKWIPNLKTIRKYWINTLQTFFNVLYLMWFSQKCSFFLSWLLLWWSSTVWQLSTTTLTLTTPPIFKQPTLIISILVIQSKKEFYFTLSLH